MASGLEIVLADVIKIVNFIHSHLKKHRMVSELCKDISWDVVGLQIIQRKSFRAGVSFQA